ncbi:hypothetical protein AAFC00_003311 [Neodothiora populina]|uniref:Ribokinase n=1 Tax=Neodothiora populina TaxID=2781224 RepID=A0ABR3PB68_9PEZI
MVKGTIAVIGSLNVDCITRTPRVPSGGETLRVSSFDTGFGGKGANQAVACARLAHNKDGSVPDTMEIKVSMVGAVGEDIFGSDFISALEKDHIDTSHVQRIPDGKTGTANIIVEEDSGENRILFFPGANYAIGDDAKDLVPEDADVVVFQMEIPFQQVIHNIKLAHKKGKYVILNTAPATPLPEDLYGYIDCLITNESEADILRESSQPLRVDDCPAVCKQFLDRGVRDVYIVTLGAQGAYYAKRSEIGTINCKHVQGQKTKVVDTTAAGDTFVGALAVKVAKNGGKFSADPTNDLVFANAAAARSVEKHGAMAAIPYLDEVTPHL